MTIGEKGESCHHDHRPSESVVVDVGGDVGALVVYTTHALQDEEIEICPVGDTSRTHTIVRARELPGSGVVYAGVFPSLPEGDYWLLPFGPLPEAAVRVDGGLVTEFSW